jgi:hypothetical protein
VVESSPKAQSKVSVKPSLSLGEGLRVRLSLLREGLRVRLSLQGEVLRMRMIYKYSIESRQLKVYKF